MKAEYGKYYLLDNSKYYFCIDISRLVKFPDALVVKCDSGFLDDHHFGLLVDTTNPNGPDYDTNHQIEFSDADVIIEYTLRDMPLLYTDFDYKNKKI